MSLLGGFVEGQLKGKASEALALGLTKKCQPPQIILFINKNFEK